MSSPWKRTRPADTGSIPHSARNRVVFPAPLEPMMATAWPAPTSTSTPSTTFSPRYPAARPDTSSIVALAEIGVDHVGVTHDGLRLALGQHPPEVEDDHPLGQAHHRLHDVLHPDDGDPECVTGGAHDLEGRGKLRVVESRHHLVDEQQPRPTRQRLRHLEEALLVEVEIPDGLIGPALEADEGRLLLRPWVRLRLSPPAAAGAEHGAQHHVLQGRHGPERQRGLHHHRDPPLPD